MLRREVMLAAELSWACFPGSIQFLFDGRKRKASTPSISTAAGEGWRGRAAWLCRVPPRPPAGETAATVPGVTC